MLARQRFGDEAAETADLQACPVAPPYRVSEGDDRNWRQVGLALHIGADGQRIIFRQIEVEQDEIRFGGHGSDLSDDAGAGSVASDLYPQLAQQTAGHQQLVGVAGDEQGADSVSGRNKAFWQRSCAFVWQRCPSHRSDSSMRSEAN